ncbi:hypothetical protein EDC04DRAFT_2610789 [Pisolithus marmoratus]|nr:hypothetical protein EDC04DRAFT_2610789 [Pisolithus marmoratus]
MPTLAMQTQGHTIATLHRFTSKLPGYDRVNVVKFESGTHHQLLCLMDNSTEPKPMDDQWSEVAQEHPLPMHDQWRTLSKVAQEHPLPMDDQWRTLSEVAQEHPLILKWPSEDDWVQGHHTAKSTRWEAEEHAAHASQVNLLNTLKAIMSHEPLKTTDSPGPTAATPRQSPAVSSDVQGLVTPSSNHQPLQQPTSIQLMTPSSDTTQRPGCPSQAQQPASIQAILDAQQCGPNATCSKGKKRAAALSVSQAQLRQEEFHFQDLMLPTWPSVVPPQGNPNPSGSSDLLAPLLSYFSQGLDTLLHSIQASQMMSHNALMKEVNDLHQQLNMSKTASAAQLSNVQSCKTHKQYKFIPSNPGSPPTRQDKQEHHVFMESLVISISTQSSVPSPKMR